MQKTDKGPKSRNLKETEGKLSPIIFCDKRNLKRTRTENDSHQRNNLKNGMT